MENKNGVTQNFGKNNGIMPCPYCNEPEGENVILGYNYPHYMITCIPCSITMKHDRKDKVIGFWNNRLFKPTPAVDELNLDERLDTMLTINSRDTNMGKFVDKDCIMTSMHQSYQAGYTDSTHHNYASFVALIEAYKSEFNGFDIYNDDYTANVAHDTAMGVLTDLLNKIKL